MTTTLTKKKLVLDTKKFLEEVSFPFGELSIKPSDLLREGFTEAHVEILKLILGGSVDEKTGEEDENTSDDVTARVILDEKGVKVLPPTNARVRIVFSIASDRDVVFKLGKAETKIRLSSGKGMVVKEPYASLVSVECLPGTSTMKVKRGVKKPSTGFAVVEISRKTTDPPAAATSESVKVVGEDEIGVHDDGDTSSCEVLDAKLTQ